VKSLLLLCTLLPLVLLTSACTDSAMSQLSDKELRVRHAKCIMSADLSAAEIQVCKNIARECDRRAREGNWAC